MYSNRRRPGLYWAHWSIPALPYFTCRSRVHHARAPRLGHYRPRRAARSACWHPALPVAYKARPSPPSFPLPTPAARAHPPHPFNTTPPSRGCSSTETPSPCRNLAGEPPPLPRHPLPVSRPNAPLLLRLISLHHLPQHQRAAGLCHHR
jgi:hypothetical protein